GAERDQRVEVAALREALQRERRFQRARHGDDGDALVGDLRFLQRAQRATQKPPADLGIEPRLHDGDTALRAVGRRLDPADHAGGHWTTFALTGLPSALTRSRACSRSGRPSALTMPRARAAP